MTLQVVAQAHTIATMQRYSRRLQCQAHIIVLARPGRALGPIAYVWHRAAGVAEKRVHCRDVSTFARQLLSAPVEHAKLAEQLLPDWHTIRGMRQLSAIPARHAMQLQRGKQR